MAADESTLTAKELVETGATVTLPLHLKWSGPRAYDLSDPGALRVFYETVLSEGTARDIAAYIDPDTLLRIWDELVLPEHTEGAWGEYFARRCGKTVRRLRRRRSA